MRVLVGDIGGTKTGIGVAETDGLAVTLREVRRYPSAAFDSLESLIIQYLQETGQVPARDCHLGAFAVAGPVEGRHCRTTNLPWEIDADLIEHILEFRAVGLLNDLEAVAWGVAALGPDDVAEIHPGGAPQQPAVGNACVVAAGTGLGEAGLYWDGTRHHPFATEGGHTDFAPLDEREFALLGFLQKRFGRVSWERVASGMGIGNLYDFLLTWHQAATPDWLAAEIAAGDTAAAVAAAAGRCPICRETMDLFFSLFGRESGNLALKHLALGGVYLGGGIAPKNLEALRASRFLDGFFAKGRMEPHMRRMPVRVILRAETPLLGAARYMGLR
ncbi:glucokinase [Candidatus Thiodictyon syntrophicum]|jgi:glucokinase|uniref:Glucokinase n=1 Tax=Candidatus Thiodictyon syntrophicum TaxID=1166950 RepID=A0A2K8UA39_9GAMM|nr:glucokinase [Candidatus Thiodictyon syntrophicum]AUB82446.1 glucokinase [Candidatus Thiodictyon syntrophicum]